MSGGTSVIKPVSSQQDLLAELRLFIAGATRSLKIHPLELARKALSLLKTLPAARDAILEYFCTIFYNAVSSFVKQLKVCVRLFVLSIYIFWKLEFWAIISCNLNVEKMCYDVNVIIII